MFVDREPLIEARVRAAGLLPRCRRGRHGRAAGEVDLRDRGLVGRDDLAHRRREVRRLRGGGVRRVAPEAIRAGEGVDRRLIVRGRRREVQALSDRLQRRGLQLHLGRGGAAGSARPVADPGGEDLAAGVVVGEPAIVAAAHLHDDLRGGRLPEIHQGVRLRIGEVHVVGAREVRHLRRGGRIVALAAAVLGADVVPEIDLEGLHVGGGRRGSAVGVGRTGRRHGRRRGRRGAAAAAGGEGERGGDHRQGRDVGEFHLNSPCNRRRLQRRPAAANSCASGTRRSSSRSAWRRGRCSARGSTRP